MNLPVEPDSPELALAEEIAHELALDGFNPGLALPVALRIMCVVVQSVDDPLIGVAHLRESRRQSDEWWVKYHPKTKRAKEARLRLAEVKNVST